MKPTDPDVVKLIQEALEEIVVFYCTYCQNTGYDDYDDYTDCKGCGGKSADERKLDAVVVRVADFAEAILCHVYRDPSVPQRVGALKAGLKALRGEQ